MKILEETNHFFEVSISYEMSKVSHQGWIKKGKYIGALARNEQEYMTLTLYDQPDQKKAQKTELKQWKSQFITIITCSNKWILIELDYNGKRTTGWIPSEKLCANNYSTCS